MDEQYPQQTLPPQKPPILPQNVNPVPPSQQPLYGKRGWVKPVLVALIILPLIWFVFQAAALFFFLNPSSTIKRAEEFKKKNQVPTFFPTPTPDETANWKTYTNNDYRFSFKYPQQFTLDKVTKEPKSPERIIAEQYAIEFNTGKIPQSQPSAPLNVSGLIITVIPTNGRTLSQYIPTKNLGDAKVVYLEKTGGANEIAKMIALQLPVNQAFIIGYIRKEPYIFTLTHSENNLTAGGGGKGDSDDILTYIDQILSTFKFLDQTATPTTSPEGKFCGGIAGNLPENKCPTGYECQLDGNYPDASGKCVKE